MPCEPGIVSVARQTPQHALFYKGRIILGINHIYRRHFDPSSAIFTWAEAVDTGLTCPEQHGSLSGERSGFTVKRYESRYVSAAPRNRSSGRLRMNDLVSVISLIFKSAFISVRTAASVEND